MKALILAALAIVLLVSACVRPPITTGEQPEIGSLGIQEQGNPGLGELPNPSEDTGLTGEQVDLGPLV